MAPRCQTVRCIACSLALLPLLACSGSSDGDPPSHPVTEDTSSPSSSGTRVPNRPEPILDTRGSVFTTQLNIDNSHTAPSSSSNAQVGLSSGEEPPSSTGASSSSSNLTVVNNPSALPAADRVVGLAWKAEDRSFRLVYVTRSPTPDEGVISNVGMPDGVLMGASTLDPVGQRYFTLANGLLREVSLVTGKITTHQAQELGSLLEYDPVDDAILSVGGIPAGNRLVRLTLSSDVVQEVVRFDDTGVSQGISAFDPVSRRFYLTTSVDVPPWLPIIFAVDVDTGAIVEKYPSRLMNYEFNPMDDTLVGLEYVEGVGFISAVNLRTGTSRRLGSVPGGAYQGSSSVDETGRWYFYIAAGPQGGNNGLHVIDTVSGTLAAFIPSCPCHGIEYWAPTTSPR